MFTIGFEIADYVRVKKNYFGGQCPSFISGSGITWDQPQFYLFSYILSNGCRYALPAGMLFGKGNEHSAWSQARVFSCLRLDLGERATPIPLPLTWTTESATAYLNHIFPLIIRWTCAQEVVPSFDRETSAVVLARVTGTRSLGRAKIATKIFLFK